MHLRSRHEVAELLAQRVPELVYVRAAMVIGPGSASFEMLRHLVKRLPVMVTPRWVDTRSQPVAIDDVARTLADAGELPEPPGEVQVGGAEVLTYREMMRRTAALARAPAPADPQGPRAHAPPLLLLGRARHPRRDRARAPARRRPKTEMVVERAAAAGAQRRAAGLRRRRPGGAGGHERLLNARRERRVATR